MSVYYVDGALGSDSNAGTSAGSGNAWATIGKAAASPVASGDLVYIKSSATYTFTSAVSLSIANVTYRGYTTTPGAEDGYPLVTTATNSTTLFNITADGVCLRQLHMTNTAGTRARGVVASGGDRSHLALMDVLLDGFTVGVDGSWEVDYSFPHALLWRTEVKNCSSYGVSCPSGSIQNSYIHDNTGDGWHRGALGGVYSLHVADSVLANNAKNVNWNTANGGLLSLKNVAVRGATSDGIYVNNTSVTVRVFAQDCVTETSGGYGINAAAALLTAVQKNLAFRSNTSGNRHTNVPAGEGDITLTGDPYTAAGSGDYSTNATAGAGAALRAAGFPGVAPFGTGYADAGPLQHQDAPSTTTYVINKMTNIFLGDGGES